MPVSVDDLLAGFPLPGGEFVLEPGWEWELPELRALLKAGGRLVVEQAHDIDLQALSLAGTVRVAGAAVELQLAFACDQARKLVTGLSVRVRMGATISALAELWGVDLTGAPGVFLADLPSLSLVYDFGSGSVVVLAETERLRVVFAAPRAGGGLVALAGLTDVHASLSDLPHVGERIPDGDRVGVRGLELIAVGRELSAADGGVVNAAVAAAVPDPGQWWPSLPDHALAAGLWVGASCLLPDRERLCVAPVNTPASWPGFPGCQLALGPMRLELSGFGLSWSASGLAVTFEASFDLGWLQLELPDLGFDFTFPQSGDVGVTGRLRALSLAWPDGTLRFDVPTLDLPDPGFPGRPGPGLLTGWLPNSAATLPALARLFGIDLPALPDIFLPPLPALGLRLDLDAWSLGLTAQAGQLRIVLAALPALPQWGTAWGRVSLIGIDGLRAWLADLPYLGDLLDGFDGFLLNGIGLAALVTGLPRLQVDRLNTWIGSLRGWWPQLSERSGGGSSGGGPWLPGTSLDLDWKLPDLPSVRTGIPWPPPLEPPPLDWLEIPDQRLGPLTVSRIGLSWPGQDGIDWTPPPIDPRWVLRLVFDATLELGGGVLLALPGLGFDIDLNDFRVHPRFPSIRLELPGRFSIEFTVPVPTVPRPESVTAQWQDKQGISATDLAQFLGVDVSADAVPAALNPQLHAATLSYNFKTLLLVVTAATSGFGWLVATQPADAAQTSDATRRRGLVAIRAGVEPRASDLPVIVGEVPPTRDITLSGIHLAYAEQPWPAAAVDALNTVVAGSQIPGKCPLPVLLSGDLAQGVQLWAALTPGTGNPIPLVYPERPLPAAGHDVVLGRERASDPGTELEGFTVGPVRFSRARLGLGYGLLYLAFDASMAIGPLTLDLVGLGLGIDKDLQVLPVLKGAGVGFEYPGPPRVEIAGALVRLDLGAEFDLALAGTGRIDVQDLLALQVVGSWARNREGWTSLFAYAEVTSGRANGLFAIGPVTVTGIALGFGINSTVRTPSITDIDRFPLVKRLGTAAPGEPPLTPGQALNELAGPGGWVTPAQGRYWVAGGLQFTVYQFIDARVLALVEWGQGGWKALLAGSTTLSLPPTVRGAGLTQASPPPTGQALAIGPLGKVVVDFVLVFDSALGRFSMDAVIAGGSYILDPAARLTGGISLYVWGKSLPGGVGKGFVLSAGGYHPQFPVPAHYPRPPRIGMLWQRGPITVKAQAYAALTDGAFMIGGALSAEYDAHHGIRVQAWFHAHFDALVQWKPFYADISYGMRIGVAATVKVWFIRKRISLEVGVSLDLWLPPLGGRAKVKVWFISFTLGFGADRQGPPAIPWEQFSIQLPAPLRTVPKNGCELPDVSPGEARARAAANAPVLVRMDGFTIGVESALPSSKITVNGHLIAGSDEARVDIRPMRLTGVVSEQRVQILSPGESEYGWQQNDWKITAVTDGVPQALWGKPPLDDTRRELEQPGLIPNCLTGLTIEVPGPTLGPHLGPVTSAALGVTLVPGGNLPLRDTSVAGPPPVADPRSVGVITSTLAATSATRSKVHQALAAFGVAPGTDGPLDRYADLAASTLTDPPYLTTTGAR
ncbi:DUF6603 domain-containing protein [Kitasatospora sp. NPDC058162]|uniref:DUF6603 domain-containing protein n=1 Tax=Kitasatospora sp. NPDC058162 TaxID=3346362 RepID=UPI0036DE8688